MIIKKPYAFLIKNFRKIHAVILLLCIYIYVITSRLLTFINEFIDLGTYDYYYEPISKYVTPLSIIVMILIMIGSGALLFLLRKKEKPWKLYVVPVVEYLFMMVMYIISFNFFFTYDGKLELPVIRAIRDFLVIAATLQIPVFLLFIIRTVGVDISKFNFKSDKEFLELDSDDQEELEIKFDFDIRSIKRGIKRFARNTSYVYQEHKIFITTVLVILILFTSGVTYNYIFIKHRSYTVGDAFEANGYNLNIKNSYYTNKDYTGNVIEKTKSFIVIKMAIKNNSKDRTIDLSKFHVMNGVKNYSYTAKTYGTEFQDYGKTYNRKKIRENETLDLILIFKVDKDLPLDKFVLYYQEVNNANDTYLRKIKLDLDDVSKIKIKETYNLDEPFIINIKGEDETIIFDEYELLKEINYTYKVCVSDDCTNKTEKIESKADEIFMKIGFASDTYEGKDMIDFSSKYGKIKYIDNENKEHIIPIKNEIPKTYYGKYLYLKCPEHIKVANEIKLEFIVRNKKYIYELR